MKNTTRVGLLAVLLALCVPAGFAIAGVIDVPPLNGPVNESNDSNLNAHLDPDPSTDVVEIRARIEKASEEGDSEAYELAIEEMREEMQSRMTPDERAAAKSAPEREKVPEDTYAYLPPSLTAGQVDGCREQLEKDMLDNAEDVGLCKLVVLRSEGKVRSGAFSEEEFAAAIRLKTAAEVKK